MKTLIENTTYVGNITTKTFSCITCIFMSRNSNYIIVTISWKNWRNILIRA